MIRFMCVCGHVFRLKTELAGQQCRCPDCNAELSIPGTPEDPDDEGYMWRQVSGGQWFCQHSANRPDTFGVFGAKREQLLLEHGRRRAAERAAKA